MTNYIFLIFGVVILTACSPPDSVLKKQEEPAYIINGQNYTHAIYNRAGLLTTYPISAFTEAYNRRKTNRDNAITDVYVMSHGWNYTITEALSMYRKYIDAIEQQLASQGTHRNFKPYFIFVVWPSTIKPLTDTVSGILPYGLDEALEPVASTIDAIPLHIFTTWKQSINAKNVAIGKGYPKNFDGISEKEQPYTIDGDQSGINYPVSKLIYELMDKSNNKDDSYRIHLVGHSYGAKLLLFAGSEAARQWAKKKTITACKADDTLIGSSLFTDESKNIEDIKKCADTLKLQSPHLQSMVLFNTAMTPDEMSYQTSLLETTGSLKHLALIPRKAFVYSNTDYANGLLFNLREALTGGSVVQGYETLKDTFNKDFLDYRPLFPLRMAGNALAGATSLGVGAAYGFIYYAVNAAINLPLDFYHHVTTHKFADIQSPEKADGLFAAPLALGNAVDFFLPVYPNPLNRQEDELGLFRSSKPGLGKTGLVRLAKGRSKKQNLHHLSSFYDESSDIPETVFNKLTKQQDFPCCDSTDTDFWGSDKFYSFNASDVFDSHMPIVGSHGDLRDGKTDDENSNIRKTVRFIFNYTKMESEKLRPLLTGHTE